MDGRAPWYDSTATIGGISNGGLPNITGYSGLGWNAAKPSTGSFYWATGNANHAYFNGNSATNEQLLYFSASRSNSIYGASSYVLPRHLKVLYCVKF